MMDAGLVNQSEMMIYHLKQREGVLETKLHFYDTRLSGLKDIDLLFELVKIKLDLSIALVEQKRVPDTKLQAAGFSEARDKAVQAVALFEELTRQNISLDQDEIIREAPQVAEVRERLRHLLLLGGGVFFENRIDDEKKRKKIARTVYHAVLKFVSPDDRYEQLVKTEQLPGFLKRLVLKFLPVFARENQKPPPYGIEEGEKEETYYSDKIKMPLSQAVYYLENEVLPNLYEKLRAEPGDSVLQKKIRITLDKLKEYKNMDLIPIARPFVQEKGFYTDAFSHYTSDGELLVSIPVSVKFRSGTNVDRVRYHVKAEIVKNLAGKGVLEALDREYKHLKKLESGPRGSSRTPGMKINTDKWFISLKKEIPFLKCIENKQDFLMLMNTVTGSTKKSAMKYLEDMLEKDISTLQELPGPEDPDGK